MIKLRVLSNEEEWDRFLVNQKPNTFLHTREWGDVQKQTGEEVHYLGFYDTTELVGALLLITVNAKRGKHYLVPHGPLLTPRLSLREALITLTTYVQSESKKEKSVALRIAPLFEATEENKKVFVDCGFRPAPLHVHTELTWVLDITPSEDALLQGMRKTSRHAIRKAGGLITTNIITDPSALDRFWPLYETTKSRHGFVPFSKTFLKAEITAFAAAGKFFAVFGLHEGRDVAAALLIHEGTTVFYHHGASEKLPSSIPAAHAVQWAAIKEAKRRGATRYNFWGIAPENEPTHPFAGITTFKKGFGGFAIDYMHAQDLPLSLGYWKLWAVDRYRKLRRGF